MDLVTLALAKGYTDKRIEKVELGEIELDKTLTKEGFAADAKAVGEAISKMEGTPGPQGPQGPQGDPGQDGKDGITPHIDENGNWFIGEVDTGMPSRGEPGSTGPSGIHVGPEPPTDPTVHVWVNPDSDDVVDELPAGPAGEDGGYYTPAVTQTEAGKAEFSWTASKAGMPTVSPQSVTLPQGPQGEKGEPGADGNDGPKGVPGADGKSAYQYALDGGYTGTEEEFAEKLAADLPTGGSDSGQWKLDAEVETTEQVTEIIMELTPIPKNIHRAGCRILIYVPSPTQSEEQQSIVVQLNGQGLFAGAAVGAAGSNSIFVSEIHSYGYRANGWVSSHGAGIQNLFNLVDTTSSIWGDSRELRVYSKSDKVLPVGVKVRAEYYVMEDDV